MVSMGIRIADDSRGVDAGPVVERLNIELERFRRAKQSGLDVRTDQKHRKSVELARKHGFSYVTAIAVPYARSTLGE